MPKAQPAAATPKSSSACRAGVPRSSRTGQLLKPARTRAGAAAAAAAATADAERALRVRVAAEDAAGLAGRTASAAALTARKKQTVGAAASSPGGKPQQHHQQQQQQQQQVSPVVPSSASVKVEEQLCSEAEARLAGAQQASLAVQAELANAETRAQETVAEARRLLDTAVAQAAAEQLHSQQQRVADAEVACERLADEEVLQVQAAADQQVASLWGWYAAADRSAAVQHEATQTAFARRCLVAEEQIVAAKEDCAVGISGQLRFSTFEARLSAAKSALSEASSARASAEAREVTAGLALGEASQAEQLGVARATAAGQLRVEAAQSMARRDLEALRTEKAAAGAQADAALQGASEAVEALRLRGGELVSTARAESDELEASAALIGGEMRALLQKAEAQAATTWQLSEEEVEKVRQQCGRKVRLSLESSEAAEAAATERVSFVGSQMQLQVDSIMSQEVIMRADALKTLESLRRAELHQEAEDASSLAAAQDVAAAKKAERMLLEQEVMTFELAESEVAEAANSERASRASELAAQVAAVQAQATKAIRKAAAATEVSKARAASLLRALEADEEQAERELRDLAGRVESSRTRWRLSELTCQEEVQAAKLGAEQQIDAADRRVTSEEETASEWADRSSRAAFEAIAAAKESAAESLRCIRSEEANEAAQAELSKDDAEHFDAEVSALEAAAESEERRAKELQ
ncbi:unnamed protein product, partial [Polarella glacialis]